MLLRPVWILAALNLLTVTCIQIGDLTCSGDGSEIEIAIDGFDPRGFRFPVSGTFGFPPTTNCKWKFITEAGLRFIVGVTDTVKDTGDEIKFEDTNGDALPTLEIEVGVRKGIRPVVSTGNSVSVQLITDDTTNNEEMYIYVIAGTDSGHSPGCSLISATDDYQIITSPNFPNKYNSNDFCEVTVTADENKTLSYLILYEQFEEVTTLDGCPHILEVFDGSTLEKKIFDTCNPFLPRRLSDVKTTDVGRSLKVRFESNSNTQLRGFVLLFKQQDIDECLERDCNPNNACVVPDRFYECECNTNDASCTEKRYLSCPNDGSEIVINVPEFESQSFLFPPPESDGFPSSITCTWIFIGEEGSKLFIRVDDIIFTGPATLNLNHDGGGASIFGPANDAQADVLSTSESVTVTLTTDTIPSNTKTFRLSLISGRDSGTCPGVTSLQASDDFKTITSSNFPDNYGSNEECDITITADEGMVIVFSLVFAEVRDYRSACFDYITVLGENELYRSCDPFQSAINSQTTGNNLRIRLIAGPTVRENGFVLVFKQKAQEECNLNTTKVCDSNAECIRINGSFECQCNDGFVGSGFECEGFSTTVSAPTKSKKKILLPLYLAWSFGSTVSGAALLLLLYKMADTRKPGTG